MATNTYVALQTITISGTTTNDISFTSIPATYTDLVIVKNSSSTGAAIKLLNFNGDTASNYSYTSVEGNGSSASSHRGSNTTNIASYMAHENSTRSTDIIHIMNYANTTTYKTVLMRLNNTGFGTEAKVGLWRKTPEAIHTVRIFLDRTEYWTAGSTFSLYGIASASVGAKATGGIIYSDENYIYHVFGSSGNFIPTQSLSADYLIVGGGASGTAGYPQGVGGGGGYVGYSSDTFIATTYPVTIGSGGSSESAGSPSSFNSLSMSGGGAGGTARYYPDRGGSSGNNINGVVTSYIGGQTVSGVDNSHLAGGGGAGAGANGLNSSPFNPAVVGSIGGDGYASSISGALSYYGGGGNGGNEGTGPNGGWGAYGGYIPTYRSLGGGGWGGAQFPTSNPASKPTAGEINTGGGGGGGAWDNSNPIVSGAALGANGGSGVVIVRYAR